MAHPLSELEQLVRSAIVRAFGSDYADADPALHRSAFADYQADAALRLARRVRQPPLEVANRIKDALAADGSCREVRVSPPGFINFTLRDDVLEAAIQALSRDPRLGLPLSAKPETVVIDYSGPNVAKEMHVGHLRGTIIGDSLARLFGFLGHRVIRQNHVGDWGTPFGMLIEQMLDTGTGAGASLGALNDFYKDARKKFDSDPDFAERARQRVVLLQASDVETLELWHTLVAASRRYFVEVYTKFGVLLSDEDVRGESQYNDELADVVRELEERGIARVDQGALCVFLPEFKGRDGEPLPLIIRKKDGGYGYATTDLAALRYRVQQLAADRVLYVVGSPQQQHFAMVFATARLAGWLDGGARAEHVGFGSILDEQRKMLRTRSGETPRLVELLDEAVHRADVAIAEKNPELAPEARAHVAQLVGTGAIKYADLSTERIKDYVFDWSRMLSFEGNTGPYLQYAHARIHSILRRAADGGIEVAKELVLDRTPEHVSIRLTEPAERALAMELLDLATAIDAVQVALQPHRLCTYLYELASKYTAFYEACPVLKAESDEQRDSRLLLCATTRRALALGLGVLGMGAPDRM